MSLEAIIEKLDELLAARASQAGAWHDLQIAASGTVSSAADLGEHFAYLQVIIPTITSAQLELQVSEDLNGTYQDLGQNALTNKGTGAYSDTWLLSGWRFVKIKSSVAQTSAVVFRVRGITY